MTTSVKVVDHGWNAIMREMAKASVLVVDVGVLGAGHANDPHKGEDEEDTGDHPLLIEVATWNEFGAGNIPERSFIRETVDLNQDKILSKMASGLRLVAAGKQSAEDAYTETGIKIENIIKQRIADGIAPANSERTIERKTKGKGGATKPLIDTGQLRSGITHLVRRK